MGDPQVTKWVYHGFSITKMALINNLDEKYGVTPPFGNLQWSSQFNPPLSFSACNTSARSFQLLSASRAYATSASMVPGEHVQWHLGATPNHPNGTGGLENHSYYSSNQTTELLGKSLPNFMVPGYIVYFHSSHLSHPVSPLFSFLIFFECIFELHQQYLSTVYQVPK